MEATARHDFNATADDELSFRKGQVLKVNSLINLYWNLIYFVKLLQMKTSRYLKKSFDYLCLFLHLLNACWLYDKLMLFWKHIKLFTEGLRK